MNLAKLQMTRLTCWHYMCSTGPIAIRTTAAATHNTQHQHEYHTAGDADHPPPRNTGQKNKTELIKYPVYT